ncbi:hypothetical protein NQZ68_027619, partial [Dissostichus eleginoides]
HLQANVRASRYTDLLVGLDHREDFHIYNSASGQFSLTEGHSSVLSNGSHNHSEDGKADTLAGCRTRAIWLYILLTFGSFFKQRDLLPGGAREIFNCSPPHPAHCKALLQFEASLERQSRMGVQYTDEHMCQKVRT